MSYLKQILYRSSQVKWLAIFDHFPTQEEIDDAQESEYPFAGYGPSMRSSPMETEDGKWAVHFVSNASCD